MLPLRQVDNYTDLKAGLTVSFFQFPGLATLPGSAPRVMADKTLVEVALEELLVTTMDKRRVQSMERQGSVITPVWRIL